MVFYLKDQIDIYKTFGQHFSKSKGINVWDLENNKYQDMAQMGMVHVLGYANDFIDKKVKK